MYYTPHQFSKSTPFKLSARLIFNQIGNSVYPKEIINHLIWIYLVFKKKDTSSFIRAILKVGVKMQEICEM